MLKHIVMWNFKEGLSDSQNAENALKAKAELEALVNYIDEILEIKVHINHLSSSNMDIILNSTFTNEKALAAYKIHPEHLRVGEFISIAFQNRTCIDYYE